MTSIEGVEVETGLSKTLCRCWSKKSKCKRHRRERGTALIHACALGRADCLEHLITTENIEHQDNYGTTALIIACHETYEDCVRHLLGAKADPTSNPSDSALIIATVQDSQACCKLLLEAGADADHINEDQECDGEEWYTGAGYNALMTAISWHAQTCFDLLLEKTTERGVNQASCGGWTPMLLACRQCYNASWVQSLIETGANVHIRSLKDVDALTLCIRALTKAEECNVEKLNALGSKVRQHIPQEFADAFDAPDHEFTSSMLDSNDKLAEVLRRACLKAHGQEVNRCIDYLPELTRSK